MARAAVCLCFDVQLCLIITLKLPFGCVHVLLKLFVFIAVFNLSSSLLFILEKWPSLLQVRST
jgi:hypothetical protein